MMRGLFFWVLFCSLVFSKNPITSIPDFVLETDSVISSMSHYQNNLYISQNDGSLRVYDLVGKRFIRQFVLPEIVDFFDERKKPKIYNADTLDGRNILVLSEAANGSRELRIISGSKMQVVFDGADNLWISKALWVDEHRILLGFMGNEIALYDLKSQTFVYKIHPSTASFSDLILSVDRRIAFSTAESGIVYMIDVYQGRIIAKFEGVNKDNNYQLATAKNIVLSAGQDRKMGIYRIGESTQNTSVESRFLVYAVGISNDARYGAMMYDEEGSIAIIDLHTLEIERFLKGAHCIINTILFYQHQVVAACDGKKILFWNLKGI
ncbi:WD40 repeat domain-containing protein [Helicobacter sp. 11S02596-1]|uniref:WD40 repeat domain-containing protein n=1 Tax=Helicobacter sp. 11S02596-1 TaxID=1476194 RepID=UPI000BA6E5F0|nr:WD40 repeat domain-containing protein [Helicobacter sp. 11S02596-1]PAF44432.1 hypothetical protein BJI48_02595 [Helicobacter sp. 11S02596-1]